MEFTFKEEKIKKNLVTSVTEWLSGKNSWNGKTNGKAQIANGNRMWPFHKKSWIIKAFGSRAELSEIVFSHLCMIP